MSTHIETGFLLPIRDFSKILIEVNALRAKAEVLAKELLQTHVIKEALYAFDQATMAGRAPGDADFLTVALDKMSEVQREVRKTGCLEPDVDMSLTLTFFPYKEVTLGMAFAANQKLLKLTSSLPGWTDYHYQNQTDPPDTVTEQEWVGRKKVWDEVLLSRSGIPNREGFTIQVLPIRGLLSLDFIGIGTICSDLNKRAHRIAADIAIATEYKKIPVEQRTLPCLTHLVLNSTDLPSYAQAKQDALSKLTPSPTLRMLKGEHTAPRGASDSSQNAQNSDPVG